MQKPHTLSPPAVNVANQQEYFLTLIKKVDISDWLAQTDIDPKLYTMPPSADLIPAEAKIREEIMEARGRNYFENAVYSVSLGDLTPEDAKLGIGQK